MSSAFYIDPCDQSAWFYHRWLLGREDTPPTACAAITERAAAARLVRVLFSQPAYLSPAKITVTGKDLDTPIGGGGWLVVGGRGWMLGVGTPSIRISTLRSLVHPHLQLTRGGPGAASLIFRPAAAHLIPLSRLSPSLPYSRRRRGRRRGVVEHCGEPRRGLDALGVCSASRSCGVGRRRYGSFDIILNHFFRCYPSTATPHAPV